MKSKTFKPNKINIITLGCSKNLVDSEVLGTQLMANNIQVLHENKKNDHNIVVVNTCGFIDNAKEESINTILSQIELKRKGQLEKVYVTGCLSERYRNDLSLEIPEVDAWFGTLELPLLLKQLNADYKKELIGERMISTPKHYAYLKISEGCNRTCSFCAIPLMRGKHISKPIEQILQEATNLVKQGVQEIMLIAQELTYYGLDIYKKRTLPNLLLQLSDIPGLKWIRLHYAYPSKFPMEIIEVMKERANICNYLDMPLQHASNKMLQAMNRQITKEEMRTLIYDIRKMIPTICLRTTLIVGFPNETDDDIIELKQFIEEQQFDRVGVFQYSHEENTDAHQLKDNVPANIKQQRAEEIMEIQQEISYKKNLAKIGQTMNVLIDKKEAGKYIGRTEMDSVEVDNEVIIESNHKLKIGEFYPVQITKAFDFDLIGNVINL